MRRRAKPPSQAATYITASGSAGFDIDPFDVHGTPRGDGSVHLWASDPHGATALTAEATVTGAAALLRR